ncbi:hypothetical protein TWF788_003576 [Orbilia oligospora]|uniref:RING-type domain-containing protein n=1 Tax=Orbilia oligospora TaxID=2813651 RepID=A0A7C8TZ53_ORBOL|nr:hypothetical protein TWF788_003576 [Orbilia oligospora]
MSSSSTSQDPGADSQTSPEFVHPSEASQASQSTGNNSTTNPRRVPASAHPINPLKRQLSENMEALIAQAKASKTTAGSTAAQAAQSETIYVKLERELTCSICCELFKDPITLLNCLHNFCGSCIVPWGRSNSSCPSCRAEIKGCRDAFALKPLIDMLVKEKPELSFSKEDMDGFQNIYKPGQDVSFGSGGYSDSDDEDNEDNEDDDDDDEEEEEDDEVRYPQIWRPCPCCPQEENPDQPYNCIIPIVDGDRTPDWQHEFKCHKKCACCRDEVPFYTEEVALKPSYCACCGIVYCAGIRGACALAPNSTFLHSITGAPLYVDSPQPGYETLGTPNLWDLFNNNAFEQDLLKRWVESDANNHTWQSLGDELRNWLFQKNPSGIEGPYVVPIKPDSYVCRNCLPGIFDKHLAGFLISERERLGWTDLRPRCWYGKNCRTQRHNPDHCARLSHIWDEVPLEERREGRRERPPRPPPVTHTGGVRDNAPNSQTGNPQPVDPEPTNTQPAETQGQLSTAAAAPPLFRSPTNIFPPSSPGAPSMNEIFGVPYPTNNVFSDDDGNHLQAPSAPSQDDPANAGPSN